MFAFGEARSAWEKDICNSWRRHRVLTGGSPHVGPHYQNQLLAVKIDARLGRARRGVAPCYSHTYTGG